MDRRWWITIRMPLDEWRVMQETDTDAYPLTDQQTYDEDPLQ